VITTGAISRAKLQSNHHHQQTNIQFFYRPDGSFFTGRRVSRSLYTYKSNISKIVYFRDKVTEEH